MSRSFNWKNIHDYTDEYEQRSGVKTKNQKPWHKFKTKRQNSEKARTPFRPLDSGPWLGSRLVNPYRVKRSWY